jgi:hypothetical protein
MLKLAAGGEPVSRTETFEWVLKYRSGMISVENIEQLGHFFMLKKSYRSFPTETKCESAFLHILTYDNKSRLRSSYFLSTVWCDKNKKISSAIIFRPQIHFPGHSQGS